MSSADSETDTSNSATDDVDWQIYHKFHYYNFDKDESFQRGLKKISELQNFTESDVLKAKLFYFTKSFQPVNKTDYNTWLTKHTDSSKNIKREATSNDEPKSDEPKSDLTKQRDSTKCISENGNEESVKQENSENDNKTVKILTELNDGDKLFNIDKSEDLSKDFNKVLSLADVAEFIEKGLPLPGIKDLDIKPLEIDPQPSNLQRKNKPWEQ